MKNRYLAAFVEQYNLLGLGSVAVVAAAAITTPLSGPMLLVGLVAEAAYLTFVPHSRWFENRLSRRHDAEVRTRREQLKNETLPKLRPELQKRFAKLEQERASIERQITDDKLWMREVSRKLDFLLDKFLQFALKDEQFRSYLHEERREKLGQDSPPLEPTDEWARETVELLQRNYDGEIANVEADIGREADEETSAVLAKRSEILKRRRDFIARMGRIVSNLSQQLRLLEDAFGLIGDELLARSPEQVLDDIEDVVSQTKAMAEFLEEMAPYQQMLDSL